MSTALQFSEVQAAILSARGAPATVLLNQLFSEIFASLVGPDAALNFHAAIDDAEPDLDEWRRSLIRHTYLKLVGPRLLQHHAALNTITDQVLLFWDATQELCNWLAGLLWETKEAAETRAETEFSWELREPGWSDAVQLKLDPAAIWRIPGSQHWCAVKLEMDYDSGFAYAGLFHHLLLAGGEQLDGNLSLVSFGPERRERFYSASELAATARQLKYLIGRLAGVMPERMALFSEIRPQLPKPEGSLGSSQAPLGVDSAGRLRVLDFAQPEAAHLLVVGMAGSGKTEWLRTAIAGLIVANTPATLRLLLIDPTGSAFADLRHSPFLLGPIINPAELSVARVLAKLGEEMERRYQLLAESGQDSLAEYLRRKKKRIPRIFCICDEYTDLAAGDSKKRQAIERQLARLGQRARAVGIHLIIATRHARREIIKGALDSNMPARIAMKLQKPAESKLLLDYAGAENLAGPGDLLFKDVGEPVRLRGIYLPADETMEIFDSGA